MVINNQLSYLGGLCLVHIPNDLMARVNSLRHRGVIATRGVPCTGATCRTPAARGPVVAELPGMFDYRVTRREPKWSNVICTALLSGMNMEKHQQLTVIKD